MRGRSVFTAAALLGILAAGCAKNSDSGTAAADASPSAAAQSVAAGEPTAAADATAAAEATAAAMKEAKAAPAGDAAKGKEIFTQNCATCHGAHGTEGGVGPSLKNEKAKKNTAATIAWIKDPQAPMPKLYPSPLTEKDVADVAAYVQSL